MNNDNASPRKSKIPTKNITRAKSFSAVDLSNLGPLGLRDVQFEISNLRVKNIKSINDASVHLTDFNLFLGSNSAGKSTLLQALALLSQNSQNYGRGDLMLNGTAVKLGNFEEFYRRSGSGPSEIEVQLRGFDTDRPWVRFSNLDPRETAITTKLALGPNLKNPGVCNILSASLSLTRGEDSEEISWHPLQDLDFAEWNFRAVVIENTDGNVLGIFDETKSPIDLYPSYLLKQQNYGAWLAERIAPMRIETRNKLKDFPDPDLNLKIKQLVESQFKQLNQLVSELSSSFDAIELQLHFGRQLRAFQIPSLLRARLAEYSFNAIVDAVNDAMTTVGFPMMKMFLPESRGQIRSEFDSLSFCGQIFAEVMRKKVHYLGPLRMEPNGIQRQDIAPHPIVPVGIKGEYSSYQLHYGPLSSKLELYPPPPGKRVAKVTLLAALEAWFMWFELGNKVSIREEGQSGLVTKTDNEFLYQKGTGVSQVLPVLVVSLLANKGSTVLIEQPELHLHPALQQKLGNFFVELAKYGRKFIIETHSEYLVTRLRKLVSVHEEPSEAINIYFATKSNDFEGVTQYLKSSIESTGDLSTWPEGFFDFADDDDVEIMLNRIIDDEESE